jgi:hypothetical protein
MVNAPLPDNWVKEIDPEKNVVYYNRYTGISQYQNPRKNEFRVIFYEILEENLLHFDDEDFNKMEARKKKKNTVSKNTNNNHAAGGNQRQASILS